METELNIGHVTLTRDNDTDLTFKQFFVN